jgi:hypothetical protein
MENEDRITEAVRLEEFPAWKQAVRDFLKTGFEPGSIVSREWLYSAFDLEHIHPDMTVEVADRIRLKFLSFFEAFKEALLKDHQIDFQTKVGEGYRVVPSGEQSQIALKDGVRMVRKHLRQLRDRLINVNLEALSDGQRKDNADCLAKLAMMNAMVNKKQLPSP